MDEQGHQPHRPPEQRDWHRVFGLMMQKMMDCANRKSKEDMVVAADMVLDLCKHVDQLDDDKKEVCVRCLNEVTDVLIHLDKQEYVFDLLLLVINKLKK